NVQRKTLKDLKAWRTTNIRADMVATLGDDVPALSTLQKWATEFKGGRGSLEDDPKSRRLATATTQENTDHVDHMVMDDRHLTVNQRDNAVGISCERVENILHNELGMLKVSARWVPRLLMPDQKRTRLVMSQVNLAIFEPNPAGFLERFLTRDECWVHHFEPETKRQSAQWKHPCSPPPKKAKVVSLAGKVMVSVFWDAKSIVFINYLQKGHTINGEYSRGLFHQDDAPAHKSAVAMAAVRDCGFELVDQPPCSPDLAPSDYFLFPNMKKHLAGKQHRTDEEVTSAVEDFFEGQDESCYSTGIQVKEEALWQECWQQCLSAQRVYFKGHSGWLLFSKGANTDLYLILHLEYQLSTGPICWGY
uniref:Mos1 transposase HTH domain-containing protein n=1 Tax=Amphilophus citrinellus TaxID=61819 RepID=A0A3Q0T9I4_AMPCI